MSWNLPPGVTDRMIDEAAGGYDEEPERCPICGDRACEDPHEQADPPVADLYNNAIDALTLLWNAQMQVYALPPEGSRSPADRVREMMEVIAILRDGGDPNKEQF